MYTSTCHVMDKKQGRMKRISLGWQLLKSGKLQGFFSSCLEYE